MAQNRTVLIHTIEPTARLIDGTELAVTRNDEGRKLATLQRPAADGKPARGVIYVDPDNYDRYSETPGDIGRLQPDPSWLDDDEYLLTRALAHLATGTRARADDLRPSETDTDGTRKAGTARIRIPSTMKPMKIHTTVFGRPLRCTLLSGNRGAAQTTVAVLVGTEAGSNPDIQEIKDDAAGDEGAEVRHSRGDHLKADA